MKISLILKFQARKALGDFGVPIAILIMFLVDYSIDINTEKLKYVSPIILDINVLNSSSFWMC